MEADDDQPHVDLLDRSTFDLCIERLASVPGDGFYPVGSPNWTGGAASWERWKQFIIATYADGGDISHKPVRDSIRAKIYASDEWPYMEFSTGEIKQILNPRKK